MTCTKQEIIDALSIEIEITSDMCGTESLQVNLLWNDEVISNDNVQIRIDSD
jgi:hypothetical protein